MAKEPISQELEQEENAEERSGNEPKKRSSRSLVLLGLVVLILFQVMALFFLVPSPEDIAQRVQSGKLLIDPPSDYRMPTDKIPQKDYNPADLVEKPLGDPFRVQDPNPDSPGATDVFTVTIALKVDKKDEKKFDELLTARTITIRGIVYAVLRASTLQERKSETLGTIRQKILDKVNEELGSNYVKDVVCDNPSVLSM